MKIYQTVIYIVNFLLLAIEHINDNLHKIARRGIRKTRKHVNRYSMVYWFLLTKIFAIAMLGVGIHFMVAHFNKVLPFGIVCENAGLWLIWAYAGWLIGGGMIVYGIMKLFEHTINEWLSTL